MADTKDRTYRFGAFELDGSSGELRKNGVKIKLQGQPVQILTLLLDRSGELLTRDEIRRVLWGDDTFIDFDNAISSAVWKIREALGDNSGNPRFVQTMSRQGYRFISQLHSAPIRAGGSGITQPGDSSARQATEEEIGKMVVSQPESWIRSRRRLIRLTLTGAAAITLLAGSFLVHRVYHASAIRGGPPVKSLAVLPLKNLSGDANQEYLADGITEEVIGKLAGLHSVRVTSRTSSMHFKDSKLSAPQVAKALGVDALVEGSVMRAGNRIRVHAQLIRAASDEHFWSETYDREMEDILRLEGEVAESVAEKVETAIARTEQARLSSVRQISPEVYEAYLKGTLGSRNSSADLKQTREYFEEAIRRDPTFAPTYVGLARIYYDMSTLLGGAPPNETRPKAIAAARAAVELDPDNAEAHALLAGQYQLQWQWVDAEKEYERALDLKPNDAAAVMGYAKWLAARGRIEEAVMWGRRGRLLDPIGVSGLENGWVLFCARRYDEAIHEMKSLLAVRPDLGKARWYLGFALIGKGQPEQAAIELEKLAGMTNRSPGSLEILSMAYGFAGRRADALQVLDELNSRSKRGYIPTGAFINPYLGLHDYEGAISGYEHACKEQSPILQWIKISPFTDPIRSDPRFQSLIHRVGLE